GFRRCLMSTWDCISSLSLIWVCNRCCTIITYCYTCAICEVTLISVFHISLNSRFPSTTLFRGICYWYRGCWNIWCDLLSVGFWTYQIATWDCISCLSLISVGNRCCTIIAYCNFRACWEFILVGISYISLNLVLFTFS